MGGSRTLPMSGSPNCAGEGGNYQPEAPKEMKWGKCKENASKRQRNEPGNTPLDTGGASKNSGNVPSMSLGVGLLDIGPSVKQCPGAHRGHTIHTQYSDQCAKTMSGTGVEWWRTLDPTGTAEQCPRAPACVVHQRYPFCVSSLYSLPVMGGRSTGLPNR